ncbi:hypothetical protein [Massilia sp. Root335]|nr:hypothetical protein [Massilia sp. Root335]
MIAWRFPSSATLLAAASAGAQVPAGTSDRDDGSAAAEASRRAGG